MNLKKISLLSALVMTTGVAIDCQALTGRWRGSVDMKVAKVPIIFNFNEGADGKTSATMDSPQQNAKDIPVEVTHCSADSVSITCRMIGMTYAGKVADGKIDGTISQNGFKLPLILTPETSLSERRPQTPNPPFPYSETDTVFTSTDGTTLAGTLTVPNVKPAAGMPLVVMVTGSGPQNRDEEIMEHRPFAVIADYLARNGIASFRYDDRGVASSKGNFKQATIDTFKADAQSALKFVRTLPAFDSYGILGHSEGGTLAIMVAAEDNPDFIISLAGVSTPARNALIAQNIHLMDRNGITGSQRDASVRLIEILFDTIREQYVVGESSPLDIDAICRDNALDVPPAVIQSIKRNMLARNGYFDSLVSLDPTDDLKGITCRVLAINGTKDTQVNADVNLPVFRDNVKNVEIHRMEGLNHMMQHAVSGEVSEYGDITETIAPEVLEIISDFILSK